MVPLLSGKATVRPIRCIKRAKNPLASFATQTPGDKL